MRDEKPSMKKITGVVQEAKDIRSFWFSGKIEAKPGQFVMLWLPGTGQKPFGISYMEKERFAVTVRKVGGFTERLFSMGKGDSAGVQGPYGKPFSMQGESVALVSGGYGAAPLAFLAEEMQKRGKKIIYINGASTRDYILYENRLSEKGIRLVYSTDDGSFGQKGFCTECLDQVLSGERIDHVYCCGPEAMMKKVFDICSVKNVAAEFSLERYMKCGFGVCGSCTLDGTGWRVCRDGPVFTREQLMKVTEFGSHRRTASGRKVRL